ncbi:hypothetical protein KUTeg_004109 [Tegillarca granosa]|uniref:Rap-GAP domain-containing protein n=1 Tax=Tegillarca granosa TaxID=220873 RepID=A0ABQ9FTJ2_TEGGR|nr:hypothetical protein KUTeg_004109 [Tegillarca granosa]
MSKSSGKTEENLKDKLKSLFGLKDKSTQHTFIRQQTKEFIFTPEVLKDIGPESPANNRQRIIKELCETVKRKQLEKNAIEALWGSIKDLLQDNAPQEHRQTALHFLCCLIEGQLPFLDILRGHFFHVIERLELFKVLSENGKNIKEFELSAGPFLLDWMPTILATDKKILEFLPLLVNIVKYNGAYLDEEIVAGLLCLEVLDAVVCYTYLPKECLQHFVGALCRMVNMPKYCQSSWELMRKFLGTHLGHSSVYTMCCMLQDSPVVAYEVVLSLQRLVKKYGKDLQYVTWNVILDILESLLKLAESPVPNQPPTDPRMVADLHDILSVIETLHEHGHFAGCVSRFFKLIEISAAKRPESSVIILIAHNSQQIQPAKENWIENLYQLLDKYFRHDSRTKIRVKALDVLSFVLSVNKHMHEDELINRVVLPHLSHIDNDTDPIVRKVAAEMLLCLAHACSQQCFLDIIALLEKLISKPMITKQMSSYPGALDGNLEGRKLYTHPPSQCLRIYDILITHLKSQYMSPRKYSSHTAGALRKTVIDTLLQLRADSLHRVGFEDKQQENIMVFSPYIVCENVQRNEDTGVPGSPTNTGGDRGAAFSWSQSAFMDYTETFSLFIDCLEHDKDWQVMECVLTNMQLVLQNKSLVLSTKRNLVDLLCQKLCAMVNDRQLGFPEKLHSVPSGKFTRSDFHTFIFPVLASMVSYHKYLEKNKQRELVKCLEFGLVSKCSKICTNSLRLCTLEMQDIMMRLLPSVLLQLSKISATVSMAIPVLAFLSSVVRLPKMYANFVEDEYMSVFAIALPYTNPFKFSHYTVSLAHHVIAIWFIRCRLPFRKSFVYSKKIVNSLLRVLLSLEGLKANVLQQFEENSMLQLQNQDSSHRSRSASYSESAMRSRRRIMSGSTVSRQEFHPPVDEKMSHVTEFLLHGGQSQTWLLGNKLITITTSGGCNNKATQSGLCDKCMSHYQSGQDTQEQKSAAQPASGRRRHKSAVVVSKSSSTLEPRARTSIDDSVVPSRSSYDDLSMSNDNLESSFPGQDVGVQTGSSLSDYSPLKTGGLDSEPIESLMLGLKNQSSDGRLFSNHMCNCWCTGWAEIYIRAPSGNLSWMMRIENETALTSLQDSQLPDITMLFASVRNKNQPDLDSLSGRIDSGTIGEEEYENLYAQHFPSDSDLEGNITEKNFEVHDVNGLAIPRRNSKEDQLGLSSMLRKSTSSPSLLSSSSDTLDQRDSLSETVVINLNRDGAEPERTVSMESLKQKDDKKIVWMEVNSSRPVDLPLKDGQGKEIAKMKKSSSIENVLIHQISPSPVSSETSSIHDEVAELPAFKRARGHTIASGMERRSTDLAHMKYRTTGIRESIKGGINPSFVFLQLYHGGFLHSGNDMPLLLPESEAIKRAMKMLNHIHPYETHKIGVVYVGPRQTKDEKSILSNRYGSERYAKFVQGLGNLFQLSDCDPDKMYIGGLDVHGMIFHVATLMPNKESDPNCNAKKLHIGNDYVTVVYNDSGEDYKIGAIKGQFNYVNIVIRPLDHASNAVTLQAKEVPCTYIFTHLSINSYCFALYIYICNLLTLTKLSCIHAFTFTVDVHIPYFYFKWDKDELLAVARIEKYR